ncbi:hypothetical protein M3Y97_00439100 [Aphelenchoides bicaudatus]|nr:hypothetical protein M3Y97_00439100 [Aphelenchoides bicaudatus]
MSRTWQDFHQSRDDQLFRRSFGQSNNTFGQQNIAGQSSNTFGQTNVVAPSNAFGQQNIAGKFAGQAQNAYGQSNITGQAQNVFGRPNQPQQQQPYRDANYYEPVNRVQYLSNLCNELMKAQENYGSPSKYASFVIYSILDNTNVDLCSLLPRFDREHEDLTHKIGCLIGADSPTFKMIFSDENLFEYFLENFTRHAELSSATFGSASSSLYDWLLNGYLQRILPLSDTALASVQTSTWFKQGPKQLTKRTLKTPFQLLRRDLFSNISDSFEDAFEFDHSNYARLFQFVELLLVSYTNLTCPPSPAQIVALRNVVTTYTEFLLAPTYDKELETFKARLRSNRQFAGLMSNFLKHTLSNNMLNEAFVYYVDILITLLCPSDSTLSNPEALSLFKRFSTVRFIDLLDILLDRLANADIRTSIRLDLLQYYLVILMNNNFIRLLCDLKISAINYLKPIQKRLIAASSSDPNSSSLSRWTSFMTDMLENNEEKDAKTYLAIINDRLQSQYVTFPPSDPAERQEDNESLVDLNSITAGTMDATLNRRPRIGVPDYYVDSWNSMWYLTPKGIDQVLTRKARFDFTEYGKRIYASQGKCRWENRWLAEKLNKIALSWAQHPFVRYLRRLTNKNQVIGPVIRPFMIPKSPPRDVPVYGKSIPRHPETVNLRILASYPVIFLIFTLIWSFFAYLLSIVF